MFFLGRTEGFGVVRDPFGRVIRRCQVVTDGQFNRGYSAIHFDETFSYDDGEVDVWRWAMSKGRDGQYAAAEATVGAGITGRRLGDDYALTFKRRMAKSPMRPTFNTRFTQMGPLTALKQAKVSLLGVPMASMTVVHRRSEAAIG